MMVGSSIFGLIGFILCIYALIKDIQANKALWAILDILFFPIGVIRGIIYLLG